MKQGTHLLAAAVLAAMTAPALAATDLTVYTAFEPEQLSELKTAFERQHPDINIKWVRDSTGVVTARLLAEKNQPKADVVWGLAATSLMQLDQQQMLNAYAPKGLEKLDSRFRDSKAEPHWIGLDAFFSAICFNKVEAEKQGIPAPTSWADLTKPIYKGKVIMPNPSSSGTGYLSVAGWLQTMGEQQGWQFMNGLHQNIDRYTHSGSAPCKLAASGETVIGISFDFPATSLKAKGPPSRWCSRKKDRAGTWKLPPSSRAPPSWMPPNSCWTLLPPSRPTPSTTSRSPWSPSRMWPSPEPAIPPTSRAR